MENVLVPEITAPFVFRKRPTAVPADLRPGWRIAVVVLLLRKCCRQSQSSPTRLHVLSWAILTRENRESLLKAANGIIDPDALLVRIEPSLNRAVDFCLGEGLVKRIKGDRFKLTPAGITMATELDLRPDCFVAEKQFMSELGLRVTEDLVTRMFSAGA